MDIPRKSLSELIEESQKTNKQLVIVGLDAEIGKHAELVAKLSLRENVILISVGMLNAEDQKRLETMQITKPEDTDLMKKIIEDNKMKLNDRIIELKNYAMDMPEIVLEDRNSSKQHNLPKNIKPVKGHIRNFKANFKGHKRH